MLTAIEAISKNLILNDLVLNDTRTGAYLSSLLVILRRKAGVGGPGCLKVETFPS